MTSFRLIQASDLHMSSSPDVIHPYDSGGLIGAFSRLLSPAWKEIWLLTSFSPDMASDFSQKISDLQHEIDALVVTGDLATTGTQRDLGAARAYFEGRVPSEWSPSQGSFASFLNDTVVPLVVMPGNHDRYVMPFFFPRSTEFENFFGDYWNFSGPEPARFATHKYVRTTYLQKDGVILALCAADFSLHAVGPAALVDLSYMGQGEAKERAYLHKAQLPLDELTEQTRWIKETYAHAAVIWCIHFPPKYPEVDRRLSLVNDELLLQRAGELNIELVLSGHTHQFKSYLVDGTRVVCCGTTTGCGARCGNEYLDILVDSNDMAHPEITQVRWDEARKEFMPHGPSEPPRHRAL